MLKKLSLIIIILVLAYSQVGYYLVLRHSQYLQKKEIKKYIRSQLRDGELEIISLTDNHKKIHWLKEDKEFLLNGEMYDVVRRKIVEGEILLYCINDKEEKALVDKFNSITKHNSSSGKKGKRTVDNNTINLFVNDIDNSANLSFTLLQHTFRSFDSRLSDNLIDKIYPPPKA